MVVWVALWSCLRPMQLKFIGFYSFPNTTFLALHVLVALVELPCKSLVRGEDARCSAYDTLLSQCAMTLRFALKLSCEATLRFFEIALHEQQKRGMMRRAYARPF